MKAYQCSQCARMINYDDYCQCNVEIDPRPNHRVKGDAERCRENFERLPNEKQWHEKFSWEN